MNTKTTKATIGSTMIARQPHPTRFHTCSSLTGMGASMRSSELRSSEKPHQWRAQTYWKRGHPLKVGVNKQNRSVAKNLSSF
jgi:hypothetical protein